jgi:hypothetical protein
MRSTASSQIKERAEAEAKRSAADALTTAPSSPVLDPHPKKRAKPDAVAFQASVKHNPLRLKNPCRVPQCGP